jgi:alpha-D-ribose 1-methylphosphonate 5-triphosphate synthase subunit PhnG
MTPEARFEALAEAPADQLEIVADRVLEGDAELEVLNGPEAATLPLRVRVPGTERTTTVVGHVAVTTCSVRLDGVRGDSCRTGRDLRGALAAAICDAEAERGGPLVADVRALAEAAASARGEVLRERSRAVEATRLGAP